MKWITLLACTFLKLHAYSNLWKESIERELEQNRDRLTTTSLNRYAKAKYSQFGEEGIIEEIFRRLHIENGFFVEFGAIDGIDICNTRLLWENGWQGVFIEPNADAYRQLSYNYPPKSGVLPLQYFVTWKKDDPSGLLFDQIRERHFPDREIDFLSIDVDGADFYILKSLQCRPKVISIEANLYWHPLIDVEVPEEIALGNRQQPPAVLIRLAREMGYEPICLTINLFLVRKDLYEPFKDIQNDTMTLWKDAFRALPTKSPSSIFAVIKEYNGINYDEICPIREDF